MVRQDGQPSRDTLQLPGGALFWRVRAKDNSGSSSWAGASFSRSALAGPAPLSPADGATLNPPEEPALIAWTPVNGATGYTLQVSTDPQFVNTAAIKSYTTQTSSYVVPDPVVATNYYWRARATLGSGVVTEWSSPQFYVMSGLDKAVLTSPADGAGAEPIQDVVLDWEPVLGARTYNLQISTDQNFNTIEHARNGVVGTRYSPPVTLDNDQYYWRVAPVDSANNTLDWTAVDVWEFRRDWPHQPRPEYPADNGVVGDPFFYQWTPARHASSYRVEINTSPDFSSNTHYDSCVTVHTTFIPTEGKDCFPQAQGTYYWRIIAFDSPARGGVVSEAINADVFRFTYDPALVTQTAPAPGAEVEIPTLRWEPLTGATQYDVTLSRVDNGQTVTARTYATSWTPRTLLAPGVAYRWSVRSVSATNRLGPTLMTRSQPTFTTAASTATPVATPEPVGTSPTPTDRFPTLEWTPVSAATRYVMYVRRSGTIAWSSLGVTFAYPAGEDTAGTRLAADTYDWKIEAWNGNTFLSETTAPGSFTIAPSAAVTGQRVSLSGTGAADPSTSCAKSLDPTLPLADTQCTGLRATPVLRWDAEPGVGRYEVWPSRDQQLTNLVGIYDTEQSSFILPSALFDSQAGSAYFRHIRPCKLPGSCRPPQAAAHAFNKLSKPVQPLTPAAGATVANDVTFTWRDYLATNQDAATPVASPPRPHTGVHSIEPDVEAQTYRVEVDDDPNFQSPLDAATVDQMTYTAYAGTYPEGPLYWRVQAVDGSNNALTWSDPIAFEKRSPTVTISSPLNDAQTTGSSPLRWRPLAYAASYDVEVYKNADTIGQATNLVYAGSSKQVALSTPKPLPVAGSSYTWRVRPRDASNRPGQWTDLADAKARFRVVGSAPQLTSPADGSNQQASDLLFTWNGVNGATDYRFERELVGGRGGETVRTPGLAWAPSSVSDGLWQWRVVSLNSVGGEIGASPWWTFTVDGTSPRVDLVRPTGSVKRRANFKVKFSEAVSGVTKKSFKITPTTSKRKLSAVVKPSSNRLGATLNPGPRLKKGKSYVISVTARIRDDSGNRLVPYKWTVTTK